MNEIGRDVFARTYAPQREVSWRVKARRCADGALTVLAVAAVGAGFLVVALDVLFNRYIF